MPEPNGRQRQIIKIIIIIIVRKKQNEVWIVIDEHVTFENNEYFPSIEISSSRQKARRQANDDPIFPPADKSYDFAFRTPEYQRRENSDSLGRVRGKFSHFEL